MTTGRAGSAALGSSFSRSPSATFFASASSTLSRCDTMRARIAGVSTLLSSKVKAAAMWPLLDLGLAEIELPRLAVVVGEGLRAHPSLLPLLLGGKRVEALLRRLARAAGGAAPGIRLVIDPALRIDERHVAVLLEVMERAFRRVDRQMGEVRAAEPLQLRIEIGEIAALQQRVVA